MGLRKFRSYSFLGHKANQAPKLGLARLTSIGGVMKFVQRQSWARLREQYGTGIAYKDVPKNVSHREIKAN